MIKIASFSLMAEQEKNSYFTILKSNEILSNKKTPNTRFRKIRSLCCWTAFMGLASFLTEAE